MENIEIVVLTIDVVGKLLIAFTALRVHHRVLNAHSIDRKVFASMKREQVLGIFGMGLVLFAYIIEVIILTQI